MIFNAYTDRQEGLFGVSLNSAGHIFAESGRRISRPNGRDDWLLFYVAKGTERFSLDSESDAKEGSFIFFKPREKQEHIQLSDGTAEFYYVHFNAPEGFDLFGFDSFNVYSTQPSARVRDKFEDIISELQTKKFGYERIAAAKLFELICELSRRVANENDPNRIYSDRIAFVIQRINREYYADCNLDDYAKMCNMSKFHFLRIFKEITGETPVEYKNKIRMEHAKELLADMSFTVGEVGSQVGFSSPTYFCDAFKKKNGVSPTQYRRSLMGE